MKMTDGSLSDYNYHLPEEAIAQTPLEDRASAKLLWLDRQTGQCSHHVFLDAVDFLEKDDLLVLNNTKVSAKRLFGHKTTGGHVESLLLRAGLYPGEFIALMKPGKRLKPGVIIEFEKELRAEVVQDLEEGLKLLRFSSVAQLEKYWDEIGQVPLPPYIKTVLDTPERYQTVYAAEKGSAAAPTAGLHFTPEILEKIQKKGVKLSFVTLDVGIDTFRPIQEEKITEVKMHGEVCSVSKETAAAVESCKGRIIAVGTTTVRTLESFAKGKRKIDFGKKTSKLFIFPGYEFKIIDGMFTNFHMPKTTMLLMISALSSKEKVLSSYHEALEKNYRFLSFGDSMLIL